MFWRSTESCLSLEDGKRWLLEMSEMARADSSIEVVKVSPAPSLAALRLNTNSITKKCVTDLLVDALEILLNVRGPPGTIVERHAA